MKIKLFLFFIVVSICSCHDNKQEIKTTDVDKFVTKYDSTKFDEFRNISISRRSSTNKDVVYVIGRTGGNLPVYFATFDLQAKSVTIIDRSNLDKDTIQDYLTNDEIVTAVNSIRKYDFYFLGIDSSGNVYINPFYSNEPPYFLRLQTSIGDSVVRKGYVYQLYKERWYLNKTRRRN